MKYKKSRKKHPKSQKPFEHLPKPYFKKSKYYLVWASFTFAWFIACSGISWCLLATVDFGYPLWHKHLKIEQFIAKHGPKNLYKRDFELTTPNEHYRLFHEIVIAIHQQGKGLENINYHTAEGNKISPLLRKPEIVHLQDVARLVETYLWICGFSLLLAFVIAGYNFRKKRKFPNIKFLLGSLLTGITLLTCLILLIGPTRVFYLLHVALFPKGNQWFFYYEESLMTTLMLAPDLFGYITVALVCTTIFIFSLSIYAISCLTYLSNPNLGTSTK